MTDYSVIKQVAYMKVIDSSTISCSWLSRLRQVVVIPLKRESRTEMRESPLAFAIRGKMRLSARGTLWYNKHCANRPSTWSHLFGIREYATAAAFLRCSLHQCSAELANLHNAEWVHDSRNSYFYYGCNEVDGERNKLMYKALKSIIMMIKYDYMWLDMMLKDEYL